MYFFGLPYSDFHKRSGRVITLVLSVALFVSSGYGLTAFAEGEEAAAVSELSVSDAPAQEPAPVPEESPTAIVVTGDGVAIGDAETVANTNITAVEGEPGESEGPTQEESNVTELSPEDNSEDAVTSSIPAETENANGAIVENTVSVAADTGGNSASGNGGGATIATGNAYAVGNVVNVVNTNIYNSNGFILFLSNLFGMFGDLDLRGYDFGTSLGGEGSSGCGGPCGDGERATIENSNTATVSNAVSVRASTGGNSASGNGGGATIATGNAYAAANIVNIANTNITDSDYLLLTFNNFDSWDGNLVFPNADVFSNLFSSGEGGASRLSVSNGNEAEVRNVVDVIGNTGDNTAQDNADGAEIVAGNAESSATLSNAVNTNILGPSSFSVLIRVHGRWAGSVFGAPPGVRWRETPYGIELSLDDEALSGDDAANGISPLSVGNVNGALVKNDVSVIALTGENRADSNGGSAQVATGDAYASANIFNIVNTNIVGRNWLLAIINVFGDWSGSITFGKPDLWVGGSAEVQHNPITPGGGIAYRYTVKNNGDAPATNVVLSDTFNPSHLEILGIPSGAEVLNGTISWNLGTLAPGESREVEYRTVASYNLPNGDTPIMNAANVQSEVPDENMADNTDEIIVPARRGSARWGGEQSYMTSDPLFEISKTNNATTSIMASSTVDYVIKIKNQGGPAYHSVLIDTLKDEQGNIVRREEWDLGQILPNEEIEVSYSVEFNGGAPTGTYVNEAQVFSIGRSPEIGEDSAFYGWFVNSPIASSSVSVINYEYSMADGVGGMLGDEGGKTEYSGEPILSEEGERMRDSFVSHDGQNSGNGNDEEESAKEAETPTLKEPQGLTAGSYVSTTVRELGNSSAPLLAGVMWSIPASFKEVLSCSFLPLLLIYLALLFAYVLQRQTLGKERFRDCCAITDDALLFFAIGTGMAYVAFVVTLSYACLAIPLGTAFIAFIALYTIACAKETLHDRSEFRTRMRRFRFPVL